MAKNAYKLCLAQNAASFEKSATHPLLESIVDWSDFPERGAPSGQLNSFKNESAPIVWKCSNEMTFDHQI